MKYIEEINKGVPIGNLILPETMPQSTMLRLVMTNPYLQAIGKRLTIEASLTL